MLAVTLAAALLLAAGGGAAATTASSGDAVAAGGEGAVGDEAAAPDTGATATEHDTEEAVIVSLHDDGDARLTTTVTFDLTDADERAAYEEFQTAENRQQQLLTQYEQRITNVASELANRTGREMRVTEPRIDSHTSDSGAVGVVELSVTWQGLAATDGDQLRLTAPFDSGFAPDRKLIVDTPEGSQVTAASPEPSATGDRLVWERDQVLDSFELTVESSGGTADSEDAAADSQADDGADGGGDETGPGFGVVAALLALGGFLAWRRDRS